MARPKRKLENKTEYFPDYIAHDREFYAKHGRAGGLKKNPNKGFGSNRALARIAGSKGGKSKGKESED